MKNRRAQPLSLDDANARLLSRARSARARGDVRAAIVALREACLRDETCAATWAIYGALLLRGRRFEEATRALRHALWLRKSAHEDGRVRAIEKLLQRAALADAA